MSRYGREPQHKTNGYAKGIVAPFKQRAGTGKAAKAAYEQCHLAWRAGLIADWYHGKRSPSDPTIVWELNGVELERDALVAELDNIRRRAHVESIGWGASWCGYRSVVVTYDDGREPMVERYCPIRGVLVEVAS